MTAAHKVITGERLPIPKQIPILGAIMEKCWKEDPNERPTFEEILTLLKQEKGRDSKKTETKVVNTNANDDYVLTVDTTAK